MTSYVYMLANHSRMLYVGCTNDLPRRLFEHKQKLVRGFTQKYNISKLVYFEIYDDRQAAKQRETQIKRWLRSRKIEIIEALNPAWKDLGFRFIYPESKARELLRSFENRKLDGVQLLELLYGG